MSTSLQQVLLESWDRQCRIVEAVSSLINEDNKHIKPSDDGWPAYEHLAHVHKVRAYWLSQVAPERASSLGEAYRNGWQDPIDDLATLRRFLAESSMAVREAVDDLLSRGVGCVGGYDHPALFLQHIIWHEGWHVGLLVLALRLAGQEPPEEWEEANIWGHWRKEE